MAARELGLIGLGILIAVGGLVAVTDAGPVDVVVEVSDLGTGSGDEGQVADAGDEQRATPDPDQALDGDGPAQNVEQEGLDIEEIEWAIHRRVNEIRTNRGLTELTMDGVLVEVARYHSEDMATAGYFAHEAPDGETLQDRFAQANYNCRRESDEPGVIATGAENIATTWAYQTVVFEGGSTSYDGNETRIGQGIVRQWMNSAPHRENLLQSYWIYEGIGVSAIERDGGTKVLATQVLC